jgi:hypothetical protein
MPRLETKSFWLNFRLADNPPARSYFPLADNLASHKTKIPEMPITDRLVVVIRFRRLNKTQFPGLGLLFRRCD